MAQAAVLRAQNRAQNKGSDPRVATCRGKLQNRRSKLNQEINRELRLRAGAENLIRATTNRKLKETVALELSFVNSNLQLLKEQLAELNSSVEIYQGESAEPVMPMIPLGLKETKEIDFREPFKDFILEHYSEDGSKYDEAITEFMDLRQAMRTPQRDTTGIALLFQYYNHLYFVERRFFPPDRSLGIYFEWCGNAFRRSDAIFSFERPGAITDKAEDGVQTPKHVPHLNKETGDDGNRYDSLTGVPSCQRTVAFEKACVLFNTGAVYTQIGAKQDRTTSKGLDSAVDSFLRAAGAITYLLDNFTNAPSMDLAPPMLNTLVKLMMAQARECLFEKLELQSKDKRDVDLYFDLAQEAAQVVEEYKEARALMNEVVDYLPLSWPSLVQVKVEHYMGLSRQRTAQALMLASSSRRDQLSHETQCRLNRMRQICEASLVETTAKEQQYALLGMAHLRGAMGHQDEAARLQRMCRELRHKRCLAQVLAAAAEQTANASNASASDLSESLTELLDPPSLPGSTKFQLTLTPPDFGQQRVDDLFRRLGPLAVFSAKQHWSAPRSVQLHHQQQEGALAEPNHRAQLSESGYGFTISTDCPVVVTSVVPNSLAHFGGIKEGDFIVSIGDSDVKWSSHDEVVRLIRESNGVLSLKVVTPMERNYLRATPASRTQPKTTKKNGCPDSRQQLQSNHPQPSQQQASTCNLSSPHKKLSWNPFKRNRERESAFNVILR